MQAMLQAVLECCSRLVPALVQLGSSDALHGLSAFVAATFMPCAHRYSVRCNLCRGHATCTHLAMRSSLQHAAVLSSVVT